MTKIAPVVLLLFVAVPGLWRVLGDPQEARDGHAAGEPPVGEATAVFGIERSAESDTLFLRNGDKLTGRLLDAAMTLRTRYGDIRLATRRLAGIDLRGGDRFIEFVVASNGNRFSGFLENAVLSFQPRTGPELQIRREAVFLVVCRMSEETPAVSAEGQLVRLRNGDWFRGRLLNGPLFVTTSYADIPLDLREADWFAFSAGDRGGTQVQLRDGDLLNGRLNVEDLEFELDVGPSVTIYRDLIATIGVRPGSLPIQPDSRSSVLLPAVSPADAFERSVPVALPGVGSDGPEGMVWVPPGRFMMGSPDSESERGEDEGPRTEVTISRGFWMARSEVTQAEFESVMGHNPSQFKGDGRRPVERVTWTDARAYCDKRTDRERASRHLQDGYAYRLPTEAEWEYACRAGSDAAFGHGEDPDYVGLPQVAWFTANSEFSTHPVGTKSPNAWGLHDMHGNVWEWCEDRWEGSLPGGSVADPPGPETGSLRVARGGSWLYAAGFCRSANRDDYAPGNRCSDLGFRVVLAPAAD